jgi:hypothetical protein
MISMEAGPFLLQLVGQWQVFFKIPLRHFKKIGKNIFDKSWLCHEQNKKILLFNSL